jgi:phosphonatase-like hydrolase
MADLDLDLFLFDMAGTTVRDDGLVLRAFLDTAAERDLAPTPDWVVARMGFSKVAVFREMLSDGGLDVAGDEAMAARFRQRLDELYGETPPAPTEGAVEALAALDARDVRVGFTTGFARATALPLLEQLGWADRILVASDEVENGRPAPDLILEAMRRAEVTDPARVGAAGDTPSDLQAADAAGCRFVVGVGHGTHTLEQLEPHPHTHLVPTLVDLVEALGR